VREPPIGTNGFTGKVTILLNWAEGLQKTHAFCEKGQHFFSCGNREIRAGGEMPKVVRMKEITNRIKQLREAPSLHNGLLLVKRRTEGLRSRRLYRRQAARTTKGSRKETVGVLLD